MKKSSSYDIDFSFDNKDNVEEILRLKINYKRYAFKINQKGDINRVIDDSIYGLKRHENTPSSQ